MFYYSNTFAIEMKSIEFDDDFAFRADVMGSGAFLLQKWLRFVSTENYHKAVQRLNLVVWVHSAGNSGWDEEWDYTLLEHLRTYGFSGMHGNQRVRVIVRVGCTLSLDHQIATQRLEKMERVRKFFQDLGLVVDGVTWEDVDYELVRKGVTWPWLENSLGPVARDR